MMSHKHLSKEYEEELVGGEFTKELYKQEELGEKMLKAFQSVVATLKIDLV